MTEFETKDVSERRPVIPRKAIRFGNDDILLEVLRRVQARDPAGETIQYNCIPLSVNGLPGLFLTEHSYNLLLPLLDGIDYKEVKAIPVSGLPVEQQEIIRRYRR